MSDAPQSETTMSLNVLVVDDSAVMRSMIIRALRMSGVPIGTVYEAGGGEAGLALLREQAVHLAMLDINMPGMSGLEMIGRMRVDPRLRRLPIVVVSTEGSEARIEELQLQGIGFVHKPFAPERLRETLLRVVFEAAGVAG